MNINIVHQPHVHFTVCTIRFGLLCESGNEDIVCVHYNLYSYSQAFITVQFLITLQTFKHALGAEKGLRTRLEQIDENYPTVILIPMVGL